MKRKKIKLSAIFLLGLGLTVIQAQESAVASGGDASGSSGSMSYSIGQMVYTTNSGVSGSVSQGVQQAFEISVVSELDDGQAVGLNVSAYPNPTNDYLFLKIDTLELSEMSFQLFDITGKLLESKKIDSNEIVIDTRKLVPANYVLKVIQGQQEIKTFKIIKN
ncbi:MAG: T9SS type A sorting domain-containing protein [Bacteroidales bacterium]|nr:T9SS type A sorting domain-containing protein [Bacteroidales bacterium]MDY0140553.1 T9SS type A sorting domain-containing protein [Bacteroidales bacterium]